MQIMRVPIKYLSDSRCFIVLSLLTGVEGEEQNITPTVAFYIGIGFASWLSENLQRPANSLQISVRCFLLTQNDRAYFM